MFDIEYKGGNTVIIAAKKGFVVLDPKLSLLGLKDISTKGAVEIATDARFALNEGDAKLNIEGPGEYEVGDFSIRGISAQRHIDPVSEGHKATVYRIEIGDVKIAVLGNIAPKLSDDQLEEIGVTDILILPVGGNGYTLDATSAAALARQIDPKVVIPIHYADNVLKYEVPQDPLETFIKELGAPVETTQKYKVKGDSSLAPVLTVIEITRS
jgi:L-ascorbate metabolism protein UlaG (beta-lactamase superfamily)